MLILVLFLGVSPCLCWDALWRCLGLFRDLAAFVTFRTFLDFLQQVLACMTHVTGFVEEIFTFICHGAGNDNSLFQFQLVAEATKKEKKQKVWKTHCKQNFCLIGVRWGRVWWVPVTAIFHTPRVTWRTYTPRKSKKRFADKTPTNSYKLKKIFRCKQTSSWNWNRNQRW